MVLAGHGFDIFYPNPHPIWGVLATCSVLIFFGLSGFFIHKALVRSISGGSMWSFLVGRINRIIPTFCASLLMVVILWAIAPLLFSSGGREFVTPTARTSFSLEGLSSSLVFLNGFLGPTLSANGPLWSLSYEIWYYLAALLAGCALLKRRWWPAICAGILVLGLSLANPRFALFGLIWLLGFGLSGLHGRDSIPKIPEWPVLILAFSLVILAALQVMRGAQLMANVIVGIWFVIHMANALRNSPKRTMASLEASSHFSYALYVFHFPILLFIYGATGEHFWMMIPAMLFIVVFMIFFGRKLEEFQIFSRPIGRDDPKEMRG